MAPRKGGKIHGGSAAASKLAPAVQFAGAPAAPPTRTFSVAYILLLIILAMIVWILYLIQQNLRFGTSTKTATMNSPTWTSSLYSYALASPGTRRDPFEDPYEPPLRRDGLYFPRDSSDIRGTPLLKSPIEPASCNSGMCDAPAPPTASCSNCSGAVGVPVNMQTRGFAPDFGQIGILTHDRGTRSASDSLHDNMILPLFGRRVMNGRDKFQYYTMSNTGTVNTKLPVLVHGRNCIGEYGCDEISSGDTVYVEGYNKTFKATVYQNSLFSYIPFL